MKTQTLKERLNILLSERQKLRALLARYRIFVVSRNFNDERAALETQIGAIVASGLALGLRDTPGARSLSETSYALLAAFSDPVVASSPTLVWDRGLGTGIGTYSWNTAVKTRLLDLVGPLDDTLTRMLSE